MEMKDINVKKVSPSLVKQAKYFQEYIDKIEKQNREALIEVNLLLNSHLYMDPPIRTCLKNIQKILRG